MSENPVKLTLKKTSDASAQEAPQAPQGQAEQPKSTAPTIKLNIRKPEAAPAPAAEDNAASMKITPEAGADAKAKPALQIKKDTSPKPEVSLPPGLDAKEPAAPPAMPKPAAQAPASEFKPVPFRQSDDIGALAGLSALLGTLAAGAAVAFAVMTFLNFLN